MSWSNSEQDIFFLSHLGQLAIKTIMTIVHQLQTSYDIDQ